MAVAQKRISDAPLRGVNIDPRLGITGYREEKRGSSFGTLSFATPPGFAALLDTRGQTPSEFLHGGIYRATGSDVGVERFEGAGGTFVKRNSFVDGSEAGLPSYTDYEFFSNPKPAAPASVISPSSSASSSAPRISPTSKSRAGVRTPTLSSPGPEGGSPITNRRAAGLLGSLQSVLG